MRPYGQPRPSKFPTRLQPGVFSALLLLLPLLAGGCRAVPPEERGRPPNPQSAVSAPLDPKLRDPADLHRLPDLMRQRLALMHEVARWKWIARKPITDPARERELLDRVAWRSQDAGLEPSFTRSFFAAQIEAGKRVQRADFDAWRAGTPKAFPEARDLALIRRDIDALNDSLIEALAAVAPRLADPEVRIRLKNGANQLLTEDEFDDKVWEKALAPLLSFGADED